MWRIWKGQAKIGLILASHCRCSGFGIPSTLQAAALASRCKGSGFGVSQQIQRVQLFAKAAAVFVLTAQAADLKSKKEYPFCPLFSVGYKI
jgi:hypothetical protein